jgi:hypothetical protein
MDGWVDVGEGIGCAVSVDEIVVSEGTGDWEIIV